MYNYDKKGGKYMNKNDIEKEKKDTNTSLYENQIQASIQNMKSSIEKLFNLCTKKQKDNKVYLNKLETAIELIEWTYKKYKLLFVGSPQQVFKRDIYYCELGKNIGSEQSGKRPVVILQNDNGNRSSSTTMIGVITTHQGSKIIKNGKKRILEYMDQDGCLKRRNLNYYEIPVELESKSPKNIEGIINLSQIYTISKKRLVGNYVAKITDGVNNEIDLALIKMFDINKN